MSQKSIHIWSIDFWQRCKGSFNAESIAFRQMKLKAVGQSKKNPKPLTHTSYFIQKLTQKQITDLNIKSKAIKFLEEKDKRKLLTLGQAKIS